MGRARSGVDSDESVERSNTGVSSCEKRRALGLVTCAAGLVDFDVQLCGCGLHSQTFPRRVLTRKVCRFINSPKK